MEPIIKTEDLSVIYNLGKSSESVALREVSIEIYPGEYVVFFGPSGCGKSTLLYTLTGMEMATKGKAFVKDICLGECGMRALVNLRRAEMGMIFQAYNLIPTVTVLDNVLMPEILRSGVSDEGIARAKELLERFEISHLSNRYPRDLSGGQQQRVAIARALIAWPPILFADEATGNLDSVSAEIVMKYLAELNQKDGKTVVMVTHDPAQLQFAHRVFYMKNGRLIRVAVNEGKKQIYQIKGQATVTSEAEALAQAYPTLSEIQIKAKALAQYLLMSLDESEVERLETFIGKRIAGELNAAQLREILDRSFEEGGVGFYKQTARNFSARIENVLAGASFIQHSAAPETATSESDKKIKDLRRYLLDGTDIAFKTVEDVQRLDRFILARFEKRIDGRKLRKFLDAPIKKGGAGLSAGAARELARKLEVALIKYN